MKTIPCVCAVLVLGLSLTAEPAKIPAPKMFGLMEEMHPDELEHLLKETPVAYLPLGTFEHHGWHLPVCFDGIKARALCLRLAERTGGAVVPAFFYGTAGGHSQFKWSLIMAESQITPLLEGTLDHLARSGFKAVVILTGHYPEEQVKLVHRLADDAHARNPQTHFIGLSEPEVCTPEPGDMRAGDHAAKYETSIALALNPSWVRFDLLTPGRNPDQVTLPNTPRTDKPIRDPSSPFYAIGKDPRPQATVELGRKLVQEIVDRLSKQVEAALKLSAPAPQ